ncbi:hypothetical protein ACP70R_036098 [Stipagrostis hirtigluma subsp. patula]
MATLSQGVAAAPLFSFDMALLLGVFASILAIVSLKDQLVSSRLSTCICMREIKFTQCCPGLSSALMIDVACKPIEWSHGASSCSRQQLLLLNCCRDGRRILFPFEGEMDVVLFTCEGEMGLRTGLTNSSVADVVTETVPRRVASVGVCYGTSGDNLPPASTVVDMLHENGFTTVRLYWPDPAALGALSGSGIRVVVGVPNDVVPNLAASESAAAEWVRQNIEAHPDVSFRFVVVGNEVPADQAQFLVPAMENVHAAIAAAGLHHVKVTTAISQGTIAVHIPPSAGEFTDEAKSFMGYVVAFLERTRAPLLANLYPYFVYTLNLGSMDMSFALFTSPGTVVQDGEYGYQNLFDATVDALYTAVEKLGGPNVHVVVSETGWPSAGGAAASVENARTYNQNLVEHVWKGTPRRPWKVDAYVFAMFNEDLKEAGVEQNWGLFYPSMDRVYPINFST